MDRDGPEKNPGEDGQCDGPLGLLGGTISCLAGILLGLGGVVLALLGGSPNISAGAVGAGLGVLGDLLGARWLAVVTVVLCVAALFFGLMSSQGLIAGLGPFDHRYPTTRWARGRDQRRIRAAIICRYGNKGLHPAPRGAPGEAGEGPGSLRRRARGDPA